MHIINDRFDAVGEIWLEWDQRAFGGDDVIGRAPVSRKRGVYIYVMKRWIAITCGVEGAGVLKKTKVLVNRFYKCS